MKIENTHFHSVHGEINTENPIIDVLKQIALEAPNNMLSDQAFDWVIECYEADEDFVMQDMAKDDKWCRFSGYWTFINNEL